MNREQKRTLEKVLRKNGKSKNEAKEFAQLLYNAAAIRLMGSDEITPAQPIEEDTPVSLDIPKIKARKNYDRMAVSYREFVENSEGVWYTAHVEKENLISLKEKPQWLFWSGDLIKKEQGEQSDDISG